jgi:hypothetical protein
VKIRDFRYGTYVMEGLEITSYDRSSSDREDQEP